VVAASTVYRWIRGETQPDIHSVRLLIRHLPEPEAVEAILGAVTAGSPWRFYNLEAELDVNEDGTVDVEDAIDASIMAVRSASRSLSRVREASKADAIDKEQCVALIALLNDVMRQCSVTQHVLVHLAESRRRGRKLKLVK